MKINAPISTDQATKIAQTANAIASLQREIDNANSLVELFSESSLAVTVTITSWPMSQSKDFTCDISAASAICLLREAVEIRQEQIEKFSERLRTALREEPS